MVVEYYLISFLKITQEPISVSVINVFRVNISCGPCEDRILLTGLHSVCDIFCDCCRTTLGWKYVSLDFWILLVVNKISIVLNKLRV